MSDTILRNATHAYIAREKCCGAVSAATIEGYEEVADEVASWLRGGRTVERVTREEARRLMRETKYPCNCPEIQDAMDTPGHVIEQMERERSA